MDETFKAFHRVLSIAGIPIFAKQNWDSKKWLTLQLFDLSLGFFTVIFTSGYVLSNFSNLLLLIQGTCVWTTGLFMFISLGVCTVFRKDLRLFLEQIAFEDAMLRMPFIDYVMRLNLGEGKLTELKELVICTQANLLKLTRMLLKTYVASVWLCVTLYICGPIYLMLVREEDSLRLLAFDMWFPWDLDNSTVYVASFTFHAYAGYMCCIAYPGVQSTIFLLNGQIVRQLRILTFIMENLDDLALEVTDYKAMKWQAVCTDILAQCVNHYVMIKRFANRLNLICRPFYLALILTAVILVCMCSVKIVISKKLSLDTAKNYVHETCFILMVLMFCVLGQQVENECEKLEIAITEKWYIYDAVHKKNVQIFKMALSQRIPIYIFGTVSLSLPTFTWFLRTGLSFFTLMMSFLEE